ncbi:YuzF family protein [Texcoconibacillus texcoconensis]|uniref:DUF2642 domain-containing protein n=1 Tax=Texcoconibacillus texcoconensis TaxID=1095777 RepID=A0A840QNC8_9BACI|nr:YuzF family protein [Texcoconibacillus texcoconensis]MBB5172841.1 hypothetical protein [Texcoconibacillus texcoconensis]
MSEQDKRHTQVQFVTHYDPYVVQTLQSQVGSELVVETTKGSIRGRLESVKPDHIVMQKEGATFFVRIQEIVWVMPKG